MFDVYYLYPKKKLLIEICKFSISCCMTRWKTKWMPHMVMETHFQYSTRIVSAEFPWEYDRNFSNIKKNIYIYTSLTFFKKKLWKIFEE